MSSFVGVIVSDPWLQSQFTQVELRGLKSKVCLVVLSLLNKYAFLVSAYDTYRLYIHVAVPLSKEPIWEGYIGRFATSLGEIEGGR